MIGNNHNKNKYRPSLKSKLINKLGLSLRARVFLPSFIGIILALILNLSYQSILTSNQETFLKLKESNLPQISEISRISVSLVKNQNRLSRLLLSTIEDPDEERVYLEGREIYQNLYSLQNSIQKSLETSSNEVKDHLININEVYLRYKYSVENSLEISTVDTKLALKELIKSGDATQQLNDLFINLSDYYTKSLNTSDTLLNNSLQDQTKINIISITLILMMIILPIIFFRKLTGNLDQIYQALVKLNKGDKDIALPRTSDTYISNLNDVVISFKKTLSEIVEEKKKAEESSQAKSEFLAVMSHEIRTPMNGVIGMLNRMTKSDLSAKQLHIVETAQTSAQSLLAIINDILDFSKIDAGKLNIDPIDFNLAQLVRSTINVHEIACQNKQLSFSLNIDLPQGVNFNGDPIRTKQILDNLLSNAIKFTRQGEITVTVYCKDKTSQENNVIFTVQDTGCGIPKDTLKVLFDPFIQADSSTTRQYGGTGLGLSIVKNLCHLMGGDVFVSSNINIGSEFIVNLPLTHIKQPEDEYLNITLSPHPYETTDPAKLLVNKIKPDKSRILIVEDNAINIEVLTFILEDLDLNLVLITATDGLMAINALKATAGTAPFDLILMDCQMPVMDGYEASKNIRNGNAGGHYINIPIIAITANAMKGDKEKCLLAGMTDFISKPVDEHLLKTILEKYL